MRTLSIPGEPMFRFITVIITIIIIQQKRENIEKQKKFVEIGE